MLSQISVFGIISSAGTVDAAGDFRIPFEVEWFSLLSSPQLPLSFGRYWLVLYPAAAFAISIIGFNLLGEGLRLEFNKRNSRVVTWIKGIPSFISPLRLIYEVKNIAIYKESVRRKLIFYAVILIIIFFPQKGSKYRFDESNAMITIKELSKAEYGGRKAGANQKVAEYLADKLEDYGLKPFDGKFIHEFEMKEAVNINESTLTVESTDYITKRTIDRGATNDTETVNISVSSDRGEELIRKSNTKLQLIIECERAENSVSTIVAGFIEGSDDKLKDEIIIIGSSFDSVGDDENIRFPASMEAGGTAIELEIACILGSIPERPERTVVFTFWDSTQTTQRGSERFLKNYFMGNRKAFYIDLRSFGFKGSDRLIIDTTNTLPKDLLAQDYIKVLKRNARRNDVKIVYGKIGSPITQDTLDCDINTIIIDSEGIDDIIRTPYDNLENIDGKKLKSPGQMMLDTIYDIIYGGIR